MWYDETWPERVDAKANDNKNVKKAAKPTSCPVDDFELGNNAAQFEKPPEPPVQEQLLQAVPELPELSVLEQRVQEQHFAAHSEPEVDLSARQPVSVRPKPQMETPSNPRADIQAKQERPKQPVRKQQLDVSAIQQALNSQMQDPQVQAPVSQMQNPDLQMQASAPQIQALASQINADVPGAASIGHGKLEAADTTLEELMEAELSSAIPEQDVKHLAVMAAFENSLKVETVVQDVAEVCEEIRDYSEDHPIAMPKVKEWDGLGPVSRFGMGGKAKDAGIGRVKSAVTGFVFGRPTLATGTVLASLMVAAFAYSGPEAVLKFATDILPGSPEQTEVNDQFENSGLNSSQGNRFAASIEEQRSQTEKPLVIGKPVFANAVVNTESFESSEPVQRAPEMGEQLMASSSTHQQSSAGGVTVVAKMPELVKEPDFQEILSNLATKMQGSRALAQSGSNSTRNQSGLSASQPRSALALVASRKRQNDFNKVFDRPKVRNAVSSLSRNDTRVRTRTVKTQSFNPRKSAPSKGRDEKTVLLAMLNAKAVYTLSEDQKNRLVPKLINGACVATSLKEVAGRVSPVLMRDLLNRLQSDC